MIPEVFLGDQCVIDLHDDPVKEGTIQALGHGIPGGDRFGHLIVDGQRLSFGRFGSLAGQCSHQCLLLDEQQLGHYCQLLRVLHDNRFVRMVGRLLAELDVAQVEHS